MFDVEAFKPGLRTHEIVLSYLRRLRLGHGPSTDEELQMFEALDGWSIHMGSVRKPLEGAMVLSPIIHGRHCGPECERDGWCHQIAGEGVAQTTWEILELVADGSPFGDGSKWVPDEKRRMIEEATIAGARTFLLRHGYHVMKNEQEPVGVDSK